MATRSAGLPPLAVQAQGSTAAGRLNLDARIGASGLSAHARGAVPLGPGNLDLTVDLASFPLALVDRVAGSPGLRGTLTGQARIGGTLADPAARFTLDARGVSARIMDEFGLPALGLSASGVFTAGGLPAMGSGTLQVARDSTSQQNSMQRVQGRFAHAEQSLKLYEAIVAPESESFIEPGVQRMLDLVLENPDLFKNFVELYGTHYLARESCV